VRLSSASLLLKCKRVAERIFDLTEDKVVELKEDLIHCKVRMVI
jgi:hypothetical protein